MAVPKVFCFKRRLTLWFLFSDEAFFWFRLFRSTVVIVKLLKGWMRWLTDCFGSMLVRLLKKGSLPMRQRS
jgi:hypothetical protein